eukprot:1162010-Pelagomonas_calceolata.AAC.11
MQLGVVFQQYQQVSPQKKEPSSAPAVSSKWGASARPCCFPACLQALANSMWALASLGDTNATGLALEAMDEMRQSIAHLSAQDISNLCWAFGTLAPKERTARSSQVWLIVRALLKTSCHCRLDEAAYATHVLPMLHAVADRVADGGLKGALSQNCEFGVLYGQSHDLAREVFDTAVALPHVNAI